MLQLVLLHLHLALELICCVRLLLGEITMLAAAAAVVAVLEYCHMLLLLMKGTADRGVKLRKLVEVLVVKLMTPDMGG